MGVALTRRIIARRQRNVNRQASRLLELWPEFSDNLRKAECERENDAGQEGFT